MRVLGAALLLAILLAASVAADPNDLEGGVFIVHQVPALSFSSEPPTGDWCTSYLPYAIGSCDEQVNRVDVADRARVAWFVLAAWYEPKTWCAAEFGFGDYDPLLFSFVDHGPCFPGEGLEIPTYDWPAPNHGTSIAAVGQSWSGNFVPVYAFFGYAYADPAPGRIPLGIDPGQGFGGTCNCAVPPALYPAFQFGALGVNTDGIDACPQFPVPHQDRVCCVADACYLLPYEEECDALGGVWHPIWISCGPPNPCAVLPMVCCVGTECILVESFEECEALGGALLAGFHDCAPQPCGSPPSPVPATTWGAIKAMYR
jgi:hypothetical protein